MSPTLPARVPSASAAFRFVRIRTFFLLVLASLVAGLFTAAGSPTAAASPDPSDPNCCFYKVQGTVWYDQNGDGIKQGTEPPLAGWTVQALDIANNVVGTTTTNGAGLYNFDVPVACGATFKIKSIVQSGWTQTFPPSNGLHTGTGNGCSEIPLGPYNFGNNQPACAPFTKTYTLDADFNMGTLNGAVTNVNQLELANTPTTWPYAWIANSGDGTLSKVDTNTGNEVARYYTGPPDINLYAGLAPSRTVVDANGNCWVANRNYSGTGPASVTQIALTGGIDWNANSVINTSGDWNSNGVIDPAEILPWGQDERVIRHYQLGAVGEQARGMTLDKTGGLWVGLSVAQTVVKVNPNLSTATYNASQVPSAPPILITVPIGYMPYGLALSPNGKIYLSTGGERAFEIDPGIASGGTGAGPAVTENIYHPNIYNYGLCVDRNCIVWFALTYTNGPNYGCMRWDPTLTLGNPANGWTVSAPGAAGPGRGICVDFNN
ncbi:MAG TPA: SdrD B-like domain-containing protein, partial [Candidatus Eisenbacteria bacterium]